MGSIVVYTQEDIAWLEKQRVKQKLEQRVHYIKKLKDPSTRKKLGRPRKNNTQ